MSILNEQTHLLEISQEKSDHFRKEPLDFCLSATTYLLDSLPFILKDAQYLCPCKQNELGPTNAISNLVFSMTSVLSNKLREVFDLKAPVSKEIIVTKLKCYG